MERLVELAKNLDRVVVLTGAGISAESGIPTFRGKDGLWNRYNPTELATFEAFERDPLLVWQWYLWRMHLIANASPNPGHYALARMERLYPSFLLVTQNVDGLHREAGSKNIVELHGNIFEGKCRYCGKHYSEREFAELSPFADKSFLRSVTEQELKERVFPELRRNLPVCKRCGELVGPGVVWFGEELPPAALESALRASSAAELFFSVGTSAVVQPAASLPLVAKRSGAILVEVNPEETPLSARCDFVFRESAASFLPRFVEALSSR